MIKFPIVAVNEDGGIDSTQKNLEALAKIEELDCSNYKQLVTIDELIKHMTNLKTLRCRNNSLFELNISKNIKLTYLTCSSNQLSNLDVSNNIELGELYCIKIN
jgi:Leucine-rich repeat (LRR) protein